jgi:P27 family predicted phage terminase small subunit
MGTRGPARKPTNLALLHGDRPSRINDAEPRPRDKPPDMPAWLSDLAAEEWHRIAPDLVVMGTAKAVDATALGAYCEAVARLRVAAELVAKSGPLLIGREGQAVKNPAVAQARDASYEVRMWAREFGFTPSARAPMRLDVTHRELPGERLLS